MNGTSMLHTRAILLMPPMTTNPVKKAMMIPMRMGEMP